MSCYCLMIFSGLLFHHAYLIQCLTINALPPTAGPLNGESIVRLPHVGQLSQEYQRRLVMRFEWTFCSIRNRLASGCDNPKFLDGELI